MMIKKSRIYLQLLNLSVFIIGCGYCLFRDQKILAPIIIVIGIIAFIIFSVFLIKNKGWSWSKKHRFFHIISIISLSVLTIAFIHYLLLMNVSEYLPLWERKEPTKAIIFGVVPLIFSSILIRLEGLE
jgi:MFS family permease